MVSNLNLIPQALTKQSVNVRQERRQLLRAFWLSVAVLFLVELYTVRNISITSVLGASLIAFAALVPVYLWCSGSALGLPIFPILTLTYLWTHALALVSEHPDVIIYSPEEHFFASVTVAGFLGLATFVWFQFVNGSSPEPKRYYVLKGQNSDGFFLFILAVGAFFNISAFGGWFTVNYGIFTLIRGVILGLNVLAVFALSYRCGTRQSSASTSTVFLVLVSLIIITNAASLLLYGALSITLIAVFAFIIGRKKVPWLPMILVLMFLLPLHYGKSEMRKKYWDSYNPHYVQPWEYIDWYTEWIGYSYDYLTATTHKEKKQSFAERASLMNLLLLVQTETPKNLPYLSGKTYAIIPQLLIPRALNRNKVVSHEGTHLISIHYGLQNRAATLTTTIGWGLLNEAYANFGLLGCTGLAIVSGAGYGQATRWSMNTSLLSSRSLFAVLLMSLAFQTEFSAGVFISSLFQSVVPLVVITFVFMKVYKNEGITFTSWS